MLNSTPGGNGTHCRTHLDDSIINKMGKISDAEIAEIIGLTREAITYHRNRLGINPMPIKNRNFNLHRKGKPAYNRQIFSQDLIEKMGKIPDKEVAELAGVHRRTVQNFRKRNNIPCYIPRGENHQMAKLSNDNVSIIFKRYKNGNKITKIAKDYNVNYKTVYNIIKGKSWKDFKND